MQAERQPIAQLVDLPDQRVEILAPIADEVQHGPEHLAFEQRHRWDFDQGGCDERAVELVQLALIVRLENRASLRAKPFDVAKEARFGLVVDDRADVRRKEGGIAHSLLGHRPLQHADHGFRNVLLQAEYAQGGAPLAGAAECGGQHVADDLFGQGG